MYLLGCSVLSTTLSLRVLGGAWASGSGRSGCHSLLDDFAIAFNLSGSAVPHLSIGPHKGIIMKIKFS